MNNLSLAINYVLQIMLFQYGQNVFINNCCVNILKHAATEDNKKSLQFVI